MYKYVVIFLTGYCVIVKLVTVKRIKVEFRADMWCRLR